MVLARVCLVVLKETALHITGVEFSSGLWECNLVEVQFPDSVKVKEL